MEPIRTIESRTVVIPRENIDTDQIIPGRFLKVTDKQGLGKALFSDSPISPTTVTSGSSSRGTISRSKYARSAGSTFAAIRRGHPQAFAMAIARSTRFSGEMRPRNAR